MKNKKYCLSIFCLIGITLFPLPFFGCNKTAGHGQAASPGLVDGSGEDNSKSPQTDFVYDKVSYLYGDSWDNNKYIEYTLNDSQIDKLEKILQRDTWEFLDDPPIGGVLYGESYNLEYQNKVVAYFISFDNKTLIIKKNLDNGSTTACYFASIDVYKNIENFIKSDLK